MYDNSFSMDLAIRLGKLCEQTYAQYDAYVKHEPWSVSSEYTFLETLYAVYEGDSVPIGFIVKNNNDIFIAWKGTSNLEEWIQDVKFEQTSCPFLKDTNKVELGFSELYSTGNGIKNPSPREICMNLLEQEENIQTVYVTGHSLGGALAVINALDISENMALKPVVYTVAGPKTGNHSFAFTYNQLIKNSWRIVNSHDEVPKLPPTSCPPILHEYYYEHVNHAYMITFGNCWSLPHNHSLKNYMKKLESLKG